MPLQPLTALSSGDEVLIDANVIVYGVVKSSPQCVEFLRRCASREIHGFATIEVLSDACHKLMVVEAGQKGLVTKASAATLQGKTGVIRSLGDYWTGLNEGLKGIAVLPLDEFRFRRAHSLRQQYGLMTNDSLIAAAGDVFGIELLASNDTDFDAIDWLTIYRPTDLP